MFKNFREYFVQSTLSSYREFFAARRRNQYGEGEVVRLGVNAAVALFHLREHVPDRYRPAGPLLRSFSPDYGLLGDIANASKHKRITRFTPRISNADQIYEIVVSTRYEDEKGHYPVAQVEVFAKLDDGTERNLADLLHNVMNMWCKKIDDWGLGKFANPEPALIDGPVSRAEAAERKFSTIIVKGEERTHSYAIRKFNYQKGVSEPVDLTGYTGVMRVWERPKTLTVSVELPELGVETDFELPLTPDQGLEVGRMATLEEQTEYAKALVGADPQHQLRLRDALQKAFDARGPIAPKK